MQYLEGLIFPKGLILYSPLVFSLPEPKAECIGKNMDHGVRVELEQEKFAWYMNIQVRLSHDPVWLRRGHTIWVWVGFFSHGNKEG